MGIKRGCLAKNHFGREDEMGKHLKTVLVVDDAAVMRQRIEKVLTELNYQVIATAKTGKEAYLEYKKHKPDFITMDITMPQMDGVEAVKNIKRDFPQAVIILISALKYKSTVLKALKNGAEYYITKPITYDKMKERIAQVENILADAKKCENKTTEIMERESNFMKNLAWENQRERG